MSDAMNNLRNYPEISVDGLSKEDKKVFRNAILALNDSLTRAAAERDLQKEIIKETFDRLGIDKRLIRRMAKVYFRASFKDEVSENNRFEEFYEAVLHQTVS